MRRLIVIGLITVMAMAFIPHAYAFALQSTVIITDNGLTYRVISDTPVTISDTTPDYEPEDDTLTVAGNTYDTIKIVNTETEGDGIADADGNVNVSFTLNDNKPFCFAIHHFNGENSKLRIVVTIDGVTKQYTSNISGNVIHYIGYHDKYFTLANLINGEDWIQSASEINISITNYSGHVPSNVTLSVLFI